jgi:hypothetical protein
MPFSAFQPARSLLSRKTQVYGKNQLLLSFKKIRTLRSGAPLRVGGLLRRGMSIFAIPPKAGIQAREGQDEAAGDGLF